MPKHQRKSALGIVRKYYPNVNKVKDAKSGLVLTVTASDARYARKQSPDNCALAKACKRDFDGAIISMSTAYMITGTTATRFRVPPSVSREIVSFDRHHDFRAGEYAIIPPGKGHALGRRQGGEKTGPPKKKYKPSQAPVHKTEGLRAL